MRIVDEIGGRIVQGRGEDRREDRNEIVAGTRSKNWIVDGIES